MLLFTSGRTICYYSDRRFYQPLSKATVPLYCYQLPVSSHPCLAQLQLPGFSGLLTHTPPNYLLTRLRWPQPRVSLPECFHPGPPSQLHHSDSSEIPQKVLVAQPCLTLCSPMDCSPPGSSVHGILQARKLEWAAVSFSKKGDEYVKNSTIPTNYYLFPSSPQLLLICTNKLYM